MCKRFSNLFDKFWLEQRKIRSRKLNFLFTLNSEMDSVQCTEYIQYTNGV